MVKHQSDAVSPVPPFGSLSVGGVYSRSDIHGRFAGNRQKGISVSTKESVILLFHTKEPSRQFYADGVDEDGVYWFSGEGRLGDMQWSSENSQLREAAETPRSLLMFERYRRAGGLWRFHGEMFCLGHKEVTQLDEKGNLRRAFVFALAKIVDASSQGPFDNETLAEASSVSFESLRELALGAQTGAGNVAQRMSMKTFFLRSAAIRRYALQRATGICEGCHEPAAFEASWGPYLEVHHLTRLADGGPDHPDRVAAVCANCHRRCHLGTDRVAYNALVSKAIVLKECEQRTGKSHGPAHPGC